MCIINWIEKYKIHSFASCRFPCHSNFFITLKFYLVAKGPQTELLRITQRLRAEHKHTVFRNPEWRRFKPRTACFISTLQLWCCLNFYHVYSEEEEAALFYLLIHPIYLSLYLKGDLTWGFKRLVTFLKGNIWWNCSF